MPADQKILGSDLYLTDGFEAHFPEASGRKNLAAHLFRRLTSDPESESGAEIYEGACMDLRALFAARMDAGRLPSIARQVEEVCRFDERVDSCTAKVEFNLSKHLLEVSVNVTPSDGPTFPLVLGVSDVTVEILNGVE